MHLIKRPDSANYWFKLRTPANLIGQLTGKQVRHAANVLPIIRAVKKAGATTLREIAEALNARGVQTARGGAWHAMTVKNMLDRAEIAAQ